ncbi:MAG: DUF2283 domain-containing protein [Chloroflexota bacterium]
MKISSDPEADAIYIHFRSNGATVAETREVTDEILVDVDEKENIIGLEILFASKQIPVSDLSSVTIEGLVQLAKAA